MDVIGRHWVMYRQRRHQILIIFDVKIFYYPLMQINSKFNPALEDFYASLKNH